MKKFFIFLFVFILLIGIVNAQEAPKYNFGSMQADKELSITPGETVTTKLYFYNIYGNRITHISLSVGEAPENWDITFEPALHETTVSISGIPTPIEENLYVEPSEAVDEIPSTIPEGIEYISSSVGYIGAKPVKIKIKVPADEKFREYKVTINALANWLGQGGGVAFNQARSFDYTVTVTSKEFTETILEKAPEEEKPTAPAPTAQIIEKEVKVGVSTSTFVGAVVILLTIIAGMFIFFVKKKR